MASLVAILLAFSLLAPRASAVTPAAPVIPEDPCARLYRDVLATLSLERVPELEITGAEPLDPRWSTSTKRPPLETMPSLLSQEPNGILTSGVREMLDKGWRRERAALAHHRERLALEDDIEKDERMLAKIVGLIEKEILRRSRRIDLDADDIVAQLQLAPIVAAVKAKYALKIEELESHIAATRKRLDELSRLDDESTATSWESRTPKAPWAEREKRRKELEDLLELLDSHSLTADQSRALEHELEERILRHLEAQGVAFRVDAWYRRDYDYPAYGVTISLLSDGAHPMNGRARQFTDDTRLIFTRTHGGSFQPRKPGKKHTKSTLGLGGWELLALDPKSEIFGHELRHRRNATDPVRPIAFASGKGFFPLDTLPAVHPNVYRRYQQADEKEAFTYSVRRDVEKLLEADTPVNRRRLKGAIQEGVEVTRRDLIQYEAALQQLTVEAPKIEEIKVEVTDEKGNTTEKIVTVASIDVPLPGRHFVEEMAAYRVGVVFPIDYTGPRDKAAVEAQFRWELKLAANSLAQFEVAQRVYDKVVDTPEPLDREIQLHALLGTMRIWSQENYQPITYDDSVTRYNRLVAFHANRLR